MPRSPIAVSPLLAIDHQAIAQREVIDADVDRWLEIGAEEGWGWVPPLSDARRTTRLAFLLAFAPEYRPLFYYRATRAGVSGRIVNAARRVFPGPPAVHLACPEIGAGLYLAHGYGTITAARRIGRNCRIHQHVTLGWRSHREIPTIGDRVTIYTGAVVIGEITVGDDAVIAANAVVNRDVPAGSVVAGVPARVIHARGSAIDLV